MRGEGGRLRNGLVSKLVGLSGLSSYEREHVCEGEIMSKRS